MALTPNAAPGPLAVVVDGAAFTTLSLGELQFIQRGLRLLASELARRDGGVPATVRSLQGLLERVTAGAQLPARVPAPEHLGTLGNEPVGLPDSLQLMDIDDVSEVLGCGQRNVRYLARRGSLPGVKRGGRWTFDRLAVVDLLESRRSA